MTNDAERRSPALLDDMVVRRRLVPTVVSIASSAYLMMAASAASVLDDHQKQIAKASRAIALRPGPPRGTARAENINDIEIREIQAAAANLLPKAIINIGTVMVGCPCEDGAKCKSQVWVVGWAPEKTTGLLFSQINGQWVIGPVQKRWMAYDAFVAHYGRMSRIEFQVGQEKLLDSMPQCYGDK